MSTTEEKRAAINAAVEAAKRRLLRIDSLRSVGAATKAHEYERDMCLDLIKRGEKIIANESDECRGCGRAEWNEKSECTNCGVNR